MSKKGVSEYHHVKYKELDGIDEVIVLNGNDHKKATYSHGRNGRSIPKEILLKAKDRLKNSPQRMILFNTRLDKNIALLENIRYNPLSGNLLYIAYFVSYHGTKLGIAGDVYSKRIDQK